MSAGYRQIPIPLKGFADQKGAQKPGDDKQAHGDEGDFRDDGETGDGKHFDVEDE